MEARLKEVIRKYVRERNIQKTLDEMSATANVAGMILQTHFQNQVKLQRKTKDWLT